MSGDTLTDDAWERVQADLRAHITEFDDAYRSGDAGEVVAETPEHIVFADAHGNELAEIADAVGVDRKALAARMHAAARERTDYDWSVADPIVLIKSAEMRAAESHLLRAIADRTATEGSVARAVDRLATERYGWQKGDWATLSGRNPSTVTRTTTPNTDE